MRITTINKDFEHSEFAKRAADYFIKHDEVHTYTDGDIESGCLFAMRFGMDRDCVLIFEIDEDFEPIIFTNIIQEK